MTKHWIYILIYLSNILFGQIELKVNSPEVLLGVEYSLSINQQEDFSAKLEILESHSFFEVNSDSDDALSGLDDKRVIFKDWLNSRILYNEFSVFDKKFILVSDSLNSIDWRISESFENWKGLTLRVAKCYFRGRTYTAFYAPSITFADGPWKFSGLPGLIMRIESDDGFFKAIVTGISFNGKLKNWKWIEEMFSNYTESFEYVDFVELLQKGYKTKMERQMSKKIEGTNFQRTFSFIETIEKSIFYDLNIEYHKKLEAQRDGIEMSKEHELKKSGD